MSHNDVQNYSVDSTSIIEPKQQVNGERAEGTDPLRKRGQSAWRKWQHQLAEHTKQLEDRSKLSKQDRLSWLLDSHVFYSIVQRWRAKLERALSRLAGIDAPVSPNVHTNIKIIIFLLIVLYAYLKMRYIRPNWRALFFRIMDDILLLCILIMKNYYHSFIGHYASSDYDQEQDEKFKMFRSDVRNMLSLSSFVLFNHQCGGATQKSLSEDFFFGASGNLLFAYFLM